MIRATKLKRLSQHGLARMKERHDLNPLFHVKIFKKSTDNEDLNMTYRDNDLQVLPCLFQNTHSEPGVTSRSKQTVN